MAAILDETRALILDETGSIILDELAAPGTSYFYIGGRPLIYPQYLDGTINQTLVAHPGGTFFIIPVNGDLFPPLPPDANWLPAGGGMMSMLELPASYRAAVVSYDTGCCAHPEFISRCVNCRMVNAVLHARIQHAREPASDASGDESAAS